MLFKVLVLGHVLLASAFENKALHELQADVDTLEKTLKGGDMEKREERMIPPIIDRRLYQNGAPTTLTLSADHICAGATVCSMCRRPGGNPAGTPPLSFARAHIAFVYDQNDSCRCKDVNGNSQYRRAVMSSAPIDSCIHQMKAGQASWDAAYATKPPSIATYGFGTHSYTWYGCSEADVAEASVDTTSTWEEDDPYPPLGYNAAKSGPLPKITKTATTRTTTRTVAGNNLAHVCWVG